MTGKVLCDGNAYTFEWNIENVSYCWLKSGNHLYSPTFIVEALKETKWQLNLYPRGEEVRHYIGLAIHRLDDCSCSDNIEIYYEFAFLGIDGSILTSQMGRNMTKKCGNYGFPEFEKREVVFQLEKRKFLHQNTLKVRCRIWWSGENVLNPGSSVARTIIDVHRRCFIWTLNEFQYLEPYQKETFAIKTVCDKSLMSFELYIADDQFFEDTIIINVTSDDENIKFVTFKTYLIDKAGNRVNLGEQQFFVGGVGRIGKFSLILTKQQLVEEESGYLSNGDLTLNCECAFSTEIDSYRIETIDSGFAAGITGPLIKDDSIFHEEEKSDSSTCLKDDLKSLYNDGILSDTRLRTETETFSAHKSILSARSPVFKTMFTSGMMEKTKECVDIPDVDAKTMRQVLLYVYTDNLVNSNWENAKLLYAAADKYRIISLMNKCSSFLKANFSTTNACQILVLFDTHQDEDLKQDVQDYILQNSKVILHSKEWQQLMITNPCLTAETMYQNWNKTWVM